MRQHRLPAMIAADAPPSASARAYLRVGVPAIYQEGDFGMRFLAALERLLDPVVTLLDCERALFTPELAPTDLLDLLAAWLGVETDPGWSEDRRRAAIRNAAELSRRRGTRAGIELALRTRFPELPLRIEDGGGVTWSRDPAPAQDARPATFVVYCDEPVPEDRLQAVIAEIDRVRPVHATYRLRVRQARKPSAPGADA
jgi:phage tail-like protein